MNEEQDLVEILTKARDLDTIILSGIYIINQQIIINKRLSLIGKDAHTKIIIDARQNNNAGIWYCGTNKEPWTSPRVPIIIQRIAFEAHKDSIHRGVGLAFVAYFHGIKVEYCTFKNLGRRALLIWGTLFSEFNHNFFSRSGILGMGLKPGTLKEKWGICIEKFPFMELNQIKLSGGEMQYGFPGFDYVVELSDVGTLIMDNFCIEAISDQGAIQIKNSTSILVRNLWLEAVGMLQQLSKQRSYDGIISLENCGAVEFSGGYIGGGTFLRSGLEYKENFSEPKMYICGAHVFALKNVCGFTLKKCNYSSELVTPGFIKADERSTGIIIKENMGRHGLALSSSYPLIVENNIASGNFSWLLQASEENVDSTLLMEDIKTLEIPEPPVDKDTNQRYCKVLKLQLQADKIASTRLHFTSAEGKEIESFPLETSLDQQVIRIGLQNYDYAKNIKFIALDQGNTDIKLNGAVIGWEQIEVNLHNDGMDKNRYLGYTN